MFKKILIANRGEIACRVITHRAHAWASRPSPSTPTPTATRCTSQLADEAVAHRPAAVARDATCAIDSIVDACKATGAEAVHPGYGFLSENAGVLRARSRRAGIVFIGPKADVDRARWATRSRRRSWRRRPASARSPATPTSSRTPTQAVEHRRARSATR